MGMRVSADGSVGVGGRVGVYGCVRVGERLHAYGCGCRVCECLGVCGYVVYVGCV